MRTGIFLTLFLSIVCYNSNAQGFNPYKAYGEKPPVKSTFRTILNKITVTAATGTGHTFYSHVLDDYEITNFNDRLYINPIGTSDYYYNWLNKPQTGNAPAADPFISSDTSSVGFKGTGFSIPLQLALHVQINRFRIGAGGSFEFHQLKKMEPTSYATSLGTYNESFSSLMTKYYGTVGVEFYRFYEYHYYFDIQVGGMGYGSGFDKSLLSKGMYINLGIPIEREFSEYFKVFIRPSYEFKSFSMDLPGSGHTIKHNNRALYVNIGFRYNYPDLKRCPIRNCETQKVHVHQGRDFRGRPFYKKQKPQIGENYKHSPLFRRGNDKDAPKSNVKRKDPRK